MEGENVRVRLRSATGRGIHEQRTCLTCERKRYRKRQSRNVRVVWVRAAAGEPWREVSIKGGRRKK